MQVPIQQCPWCGCTEFAAGYQNFEGMVMTTPNGVIGSRLVHVMCHRCGAVVMSKIQHPERFRAVR